VTDAKEEMNDWIWGAGLGLQIVLLWVLVRRGVARQLPLFVVLIGLYVVRSIFLYASFGHIDAAAYLLSYNALWMLDVVMQVLVAWELFYARRAEKAAGQRLDQIMAFGGLVAVAAAVAWGISRVVPASLHSPIDRGVLLPSVLMLVLGVREMSRSSAAGVAQRAARRVLVGFAVLAAAGVASQIGRTVAALHRDVPVYLRWTYGDSFTYLAVLVFWLIALYEERRHAAAGTAKQQGAAAA
jgi:hypothetical protein